MLKTRRSRNRQIFNMGILYLERRYLYWDGALYSNSKRRWIKFILLQYIYDLWFGVYTHDILMAKYRPSNEIYIYIYIYFIMLSQNDLIKMINQPYKLPSDINEYCRLSGSRNIPLENINILWLTISFHGLPISRFLMRIRYNTSRQKDAWHKICLVSTNAFFGLYRWIFSCVFSTKTLSVSKIIGQFKFIVGIMPIYQEWRLIWQVNDTAKTEIVSYELKSD